MEALKVFTLVRANTLWHINVRKAAIRAYFMYGTLAIMAVLASYGYTLTVVNKTIEASYHSTVQIQIDTAQSELTLLNEQIGTIEQQIDAAIQRQRDTPYDFVTAWNKITDQINSLESQKQDLINKRIALSRELGQFNIDLVEEKAQSESTVTMFSLMAKNFGITERQIYFSY